MITAPHPVVQDPAGPAEVLVEESFRFLSMPAPWVVGLVLVPGTLLFAWWCYGNLSRLDPRTRNLLAVLRAVAILIALVLLFQPVVEEIRYSKLQSEVHVLVDDSASMQRRDTYPDDRTRDALAAAAGVADVGDQRCR